MNRPVKLIECPRDAMQGIKEFIPTEKKVEYINALLEVGFDTIDFGSFVSPTAIPQMKDSALVLSKINWQPNKANLLAIVANVRGAIEAAYFPQIHYLGFPFSVSETFQKRNTNSTIEKSLKTVEEIRKICDKFKKELVVYLSMSFGNPYGDLWSPSVVVNWAKKMVEMDIKIISLADTVGVAEPAIISLLFSQLLPEFPEVEFGAHLHTTPDTWREKVEAAWTNGCRRFDGAIKGYGGCPLAEDKLTGNMPTENLVSFCDEKNIETGIHHDKLHKAFYFADEIF